MNEITRVATERKKQILPCNCNKRPNSDYTLDQFNQRGKPFYAICHCTFLGRIHTYVSVFKKKRKKKKKKKKRKKEEETNVDSLLCKRFQYASRYITSEKKNREYFLEICAYIVRVANDVWTIFI